MAGFIMHPIQTGGAMARDTLIVRFEKYLQKQDLSPRTVKGYLDDLNYFCAWHEEIQNHSMDWRTVSDFDLQTFRQYLVNGKRQKVSAVNRRVQALKRFFRWGISTRIIKQS